MKIKVLFSLIALILLVACDNPVAPEVELEEPFWLPIARSRTLQPDGLTVTFDNLLAEGRCPDSPQIRCVWEGFAEIHLQLKRTANSRTSATAIDTGLDLRIMGFVNRQDSLRHVVKDTLGYRFTLLQLDPYPQDLQDSQSAKAYKALLNISRAKIEED